MNESQCVECGDALDCNALHGVCSPCIEQARDSASQDRELLARWVAYIAKHSVKS